MHGPIEVVTDGWDAHGNTLLTLIRTLADFELHSEQAEAAAAATAATAATAAAAARRWLLWS